MRNINSTFRTLAVIASCLVMASSAYAEPMDKKGDSSKSNGGSKSDADKNSSGSQSNSGKQPEVVGYADSGKKKDYAPKTDAEGAQWTFNPKDVELTTGTSDTGTNFLGARILKGKEDVVVQGDIFPGTYEDDKSTRYQYWQGSTLYFGVESPETSNSVDAIVEFFWFESSIPRGSDFYVMQVKVKSSPNPWDKWVLAKEPNFVDDYIFFWNDVQPAQHLNVKMEKGGAHGSLRWDFSVPFETYKWEPVKVMQVSEAYGAGYSVDANANVKGNVKTEFKEGGFVGDVTGDATIQSKGYVNNSFKVQSQYTITLYKWQMLVQSGGEDISWKLVLLPHDKQKDNQSDSGYYEYLVVMQATRGTPVHVEEIEIGGMFRHTIPLWFDTYEGLSAVLTDIWVTPPRGVCLPGDIAPSDTCNTKGVCGLAKAKCVDNQWKCPLVSVFEEIEQTCDGLDNDCDGIVDEDVSRECSTACGTGYEICVGGKFQGCDAPQPLQELCGDGVDNDCDGQIDNGCTEKDNAKPSDNTNAKDNYPGSPVDSGNGNNGQGSNFNSFTPNNNNGNNSQAYEHPTGSGSSPKKPIPNQDSGCTTVNGTGNPVAGLVLLLSVLVMALSRRRETV